MGRAARLLLQEVEINGGGFVTVLAPTAALESVAAEAPRAEEPMTRREADTIM